MSMFTIDKIRTWPVLTQFYHLFSYGFGQVTFLFVSRFPCIQLSSSIKNKDIISIYLTELIQSSTWIINIKMFINSPGWCSSVDWSWAVNPRVAGSIPSQDTCLGCRPGPQWGPHEMQPHIDISFPLFLLLFPSL